MKPLQTSILARHLCVVGLNTPLLDECKVGPISHGVFAFRCADPSGDAAQRGTTPPVRNVSIGIAGVTSRPLRHHFSSHPPVCMCVYLDLHVHEEMPKKECRSDQH